MRELFVKKRKQYKANPKPFEWEYGSYNSGEIKNESGYTTIIMVKMKTPKKIDSKKILKESLTSLPKIN